MASRYIDIPIMSGSLNTPRFYKNAVYPTVELSEFDNYIITTVGDRLDLLAFDYYGDSSLWWIIATANDLPGNSLYPAIGSQLRVPANYAKVIQDFASINNRK
jgi:hypothetical protein